MEILKLHPAPTHTYKVTGKRPLTWLPKDEYNLANLAVLDVDPITGRTFTECHDEWKAWFAEVQARQAACQWWNIAEHLRLRVALAQLIQRQGMS